MSEIFSETFCPLTLYTEVTLKILTSLARVILMQLELMMHAMLNAHILILTGRLKFNTLSVQTGTSSLLVGHNTITIIITTFAFAP